MFAGMVSAARFSAALRLSALVCGGLLSGLSGSEAWAQSQLMPGAPIGAGNIATGRRSGSAAVEKPAIPAPDAIPGAKARAPAAPAARGPTDMAPGDALFDAINRGDIAAARDALNRGADLNAVNVLGMTPMELSVDLGRNDISFLLLSMRGEDSGRGSRSVGRDAPAVPTGAKAVTAAKPAGRPSAPAKPKSVAAKPVATPKLFANDGGTPLPGAGFLGFDSRATTN
jgi:hypothetical protein